MFNSKLISLLFLFTLSFTQIAVAETVTILPLGDSITDGNGFNNPNSSYRDELYTSLSNEGFDTTFIGTQSTFFGSIQLFHEGHPGERADFIDNNINAWYDGYLTSFNINQVDIVLLHAGTNDILHHLNGSFPTTDTQTRTDIEGIISKLQAKNPNITVLVAKLIPLEATVTDKAAGLNALLSTAWANSKSVGNSSVIIVDQNTGFITPTDYADTDTHPNQSGENKMANKWFDTLIQQQIIQDSKTLPVTTDLTLWLDASDVNADGIEDTSSSVVTTWFDKSGNSNDVTKRSDSSAPSQILAGLNGKPIVDFNSSSLEAPDDDQMTANTSYTKFAVFKFDDTSEANNLVSSEETALWGGGTDTIKSWHSGNYLESASGIISTTNYHIATTRYGNPDAITNILNLDRALVASNTQNATHAASPTNIGSIGGAFYLDGKIAEALIYDRALTDAEITLVENYLSEKWGLLSDVNPINSTVTATPTTLDADGTAASTLTITVKDDNNNPLPGLTVIINQGAGSSNIGSVIDNNDGTYTVSITSLEAETVTYSVTADSVLITQSANITFEAVASLVDANTSIVTSAPNTAVADGSDTSIITVTANDISNNPLSGLNVSIDQGSGNSTIGSVTDNNDGTYSFNVTSTTLETVTYTATADGIVIADTAEVVFTAGAASALTSIITATPETVEANGSAESTLTLQVKDANGNNLTSGGANVGFAQSGSATISQLIDNNNGTYTATITNTLVEEVTITATLNGSGVTSVTSISFTVGAPNATTSNLAATSASLAADGIEEVTITVSVKDANSNPVLNLTNVTLSSSPSTVSIGAVSDIGNGNYTFDITSTVADIFTFTATASGVTISNTAEVEFTAGAASPETTTVTASPSAVEANGTAASIITITTKDEFGNNLSTGGDQIELFHNANASFSSITDNQDGTYTATVTNTSIETVSVSVKLNGTFINDEVDVNFTLGAANASNTSIIAAQTVVTADGNSTSTITVQTKDASGFDLTAGGDDVEIFVDGSATSSITSDNGDGTYTATISNLVAEVVTVSASLNGATITATDSVTFIPDVISTTTSTMTTNSTSAVADGSTPLIITVTLQDSNNNPITDATVSLGQANGSSSISGPTNNADGTYTFSVITSSAESITYTATANGVILDEVLTIEFVEPPVNTPVNIIPILKILLLEDE